MRDAQKDLEMCEKATPGPWIQTGECRPFSDEYGAQEKVYVCVGSDLIYCGSVIYPGDDKFMKPIDNAQFIAESREALPYWIIRAKALEEKIRKTNELIWNLLEKGVVSHELREQAEENRRILEGVS